MKKISILIAAGCFASTGFAQSAIDAYRFSQPDLRGTARFVSMGGAFGALGGDLSTISQNPAGIGVYRSNEVGFTLDMDFQNATSQANGDKTSINQNKFYLDNIGAVFTLKMGSGALKNFNMGFTYNKAVSFNRRYQGYIPNLQNSMSNYIAGIANEMGTTVGDVESTNTYDPYNPMDSGVPTDWLTILGYDSYLINPNGDPDHPHWTGQFGNGTKGIGNFDVEEKGSVDEYNIAFGGNFNNTVYWGLDFDIVDFSYQLNAGWGENLTNAYVYNPSSNNVEPTDSRWNISNFYSASGTGFNLNAGVIVKPVQELRLGFAFHTPTWINITEYYNANTRMRYYGQELKSTTNNGDLGSQDYKFSSPWKLMFSAAGVFGGKFILSADYQIDLYKTMKFSESDGYNYGYGYDYGYDDWDWGYYPAPAIETRSNDIYKVTNQDVKDVYRTTNTLRLGAEYRVTPNFSLRAGYSYVSSPVQAKAKDGSETIYTAGTMPNYRFDNSTNYITCGLGFHSGGFYIDAAYVYKHMDSTYHAYTPDPYSPQYPSPSAKLSLNNSRIVLSTGFKF